MQDDMKYANRVLKALEKRNNEATITDIARFLSLHRSTVGRCLDFLKAKHPIAERQEGLRKYFKLPKQPIPSSTLVDGDKADPWGHLGVKR